MKRGIVALGTLLLLVPTGCSDDTISETSGTETGTETGGDGDGDETTTTTGDGDGDMTGDGDGDMTGDGDGDMPAECGDGMVTGDEVCDDGVNDGSYGGCAEDCSAFGPNCGDGEVNGPEVCDDGVNDNSYGGCNETCDALGPNCGDGEIDVDNEVCDDGINDGSYGSCSEDCQVLSPFCGDGVIDVDNETCDDSNSDALDGCSDVCEIEDGACCDGLEPSMCMPLDPLNGSVDALNLAIPDNTYDGTLDSMGCAEVEVVGPMGVCGGINIVDVTVELGLNHTWVGDLVVKLEAPDGTVVPLMSRPGVDEPTDDGQNEGGSGDSSNATADFPWIFVDGGATDAELMGQSIDGSLAVCADDDECEFDPNSGSAMGEAFEDLVGLDPVGTWRLCIGGGAGGDNGTIESINLDIGVVPPPPPPDPDPDPDSDPPPPMP